MKTFMIPSDLMLKSMSCSRAWRSLMLPFCLWGVTLLLIGASKTAEAQLIYRGPGQSVSSVTGVRSGMRFLPTSYQTGLAARGLGVPGVTGRPFGFSPGLGMGSPGFYNVPGLGTGRARYYHTAYSGAELAPGMAPYRAQEFGPFARGFVLTPGLSYGLSNYYGSRAYFYGTPYYRSRGFGAYGYSVFGPVPGPYSYGFGSGGYYGLY